LIHSQRLFRVGAILTFCACTVAGAQQNATLPTMAAAPGGTAPAQAPSLTPPFNGYSFPQKQTLTYTVDWRVFQAGTAVFHLEQQGPMMKISASADTIGATNMIYQVVDRYQSSFNMQTGCSAGFSKQIQEGRRKITSDLSFNYPQNKQVLVERNVVKGTSKQTESSIPSCVTDSLSGIFYVASQQLLLGKDFKLPLGDALRTVAITMKVEAKEDIKTPAGTFATIRVQPTADAGVVKNRGTIQIWYTDDARHIPVQMRAKLFWGTITFHLQSIEAK
jgi:Protein of unknown function (DUF3108)